MEIIARLGSLLGLSFISGINLYATVAVVGICTKYQLVQGLPSEFQVLASNAVIMIALVLYLLEFLMDKVPGLDTLWDSVHTLIRPLGGAMLALMQVGEASPALEVIVFMLGMSLASAAHITKAATRIMINASPEPFSNIVVSLAEDFAAISVAYLSLAYPKVSLLVTLGLLVLVGLFLPVLLRSMRMLFAALWVKLRWFVQRDLALERFASLPPAFDQFLETLREPDEVVVWTGYGYAARVPDIPRFAPVHMVVTGKAIMLIYRRWLRFKIQRFPFSQSLQSKCYPGMLLAKWSIRASGRNWLLNVYAPFSGRLPLERMHNDGRARDYQ
jgi:hypothetical protein